MEEDGRKEKVDEREKKRPQENTIKRRKTRLTEEGKNMDGKEKQEDGEEEKEDEKKKT